MLLDTLIFWFRILKQQQDKWKNELYADITLRYCKYFN